MPAEVLRPLWTRRTVIIVVHLVYFSYILCLLGSIYEITPLGGNLLGWKEHGF